MIISAVLLIRKLGLRSKMPTCIDSKWPGSEIFVVVVVLRKNKSVSWTSSLLGRYKMLPKGVSRQWAFWSI